ncbi:MAG: transporter [Pedobacter sp.]
MIRTLLCASLIFLTCESGYAQATKMTSVNLFNPVPKDMLRDMETDRPDITESPFTVDAGHIQYEADLLKFKREKDELSNQQTLLINQANLKLGITNSADLQIIIQAFGTQRDLDLVTGNKTNTHGLGNLILRLKQNISGNGGGNFSIAILPYIKFPTSQLEPDQRYEGGIILPMQLKLPNDWKLGFQIEGDRLQDKYDHSLHTELLQSLTLSHEIIKGLEGIGETFYTYDFKQHHWSSYLNGSLQLSLANNLLLDAGLNYGIQADAEKTYFIGTSFRF